MLVFLDLLLLSTVCIHSFIHSETSTEILLFARHWWGWAKIGQNRNAPDLTEPPPSPLVWSPTRRLFLVGNLSTPFPEVSDPTSLNLMDHKMNIVALALLPILLTPHWFCQPTESFLPLPLAHTQLFWFAFQPKKAPVKPLPYSRQAICEQAHAKTFPIIFLTDFGI